MPRVAFTALQDAGARFGGGGGIGSGECTFGLRVSLGDLENSRAGPGTASLAILVRPFGALWSRDGAGIGQWAAVNGFVGAAPSGRRDQAGGRVGGLRTVE